MARKKPSKYEKQTIKLLTDFELAAQSYGYTRDSGSAAEAEADEAKLMAARIALMARIRDLHSQRRLNQAKKVSR